MWRDRPWRAWWPCKKGAVCPQGDWYSGTTCVKSSSWHPALADKWVFPSLVLHERGLLVPLVSPAALPPNSQPLPSFRSYLSELRRCQDHHGPCTSPSLFPSSHILKTLRLATHIVERLCAGHCGHGRNEPAKVLTSGRLPSREAQKAGSKETYRRRSRFLGVFKCMEKVKW